MTMKLPDFDEMASLVEKIASLSYIKGKLELDIKLEEARIMRAVVTDPKYFRDGKAPAVNFIESTYLRSGLGDTAAEKNITTLRNELHIASVELDKTKLYYDLLKLKVEVWRSEQANQRATTSLL